MKVLISYSECGQAIRDLVSFNIDSEVHVATRNIKIKSVLYTPICDLLTIYPASIPARIDQQHGYIVLMDTFFALKHPKPHGLIFEGNDTNKYKDTRTVYINEEGVSA